MPRQVRQQLTQRAAESPQLGGRQVRQQVAAAGADAVPHYVPQIHDPDTQALIEGLSMFQPKLREALRESRERNQEQAVTDSLGGLPPQKEEPSYAQAYMHTEGIIGGQEDASQLVQKFNTEFDKDGGDFEGWLLEQSQSRLKGVRDREYVSGYNKAIAPGLAEVRKQYLDYHRKAAETRIESNAMQMLGNGVRAYLTTGDNTIPGGYVTSIRDYMGKNLGVSSLRFDELLFESVRTLGDEGYVDAYEVLKRDHPDGSPGLYNNPKWRQQIDRAVAHSWAISEQKGAREQEAKIETALFTPFEMLYDGKTKEARAAFESLKKSGLFERASDLIKWETEFAKVQNKEARADQQEAELALQARIYQGKGGIRDVLGADLTATQKRSLLSEVRRVQQENQQAGKAEDAVYKTVDFRSGEDFIKTMLKPRPRDSMDFTGQGNEFDRAQLAQAVLEFTQGSRGKTGAEIRDYAQEVATRYIKRRTGYNEQQQQAVGEARIAFKSLVEVRDAARKGLLSVDELRAYTDYFKRQGSQ